MTTNAALSSQAMEGRGFYNRNSDLQAAGIEQLIPLLERTLDAVAVTLPAEAPLVVADYGASQGRNSMRPMGVTIDRLRSRFGAERPVEVIHTDLPSNDFASLFGVLHEDPSSYMAGRPGVYPSAVGWSYFQPILPPGRVHFGWNTWTLHWLSRNPGEVTDHLCAVLSGDGAAREDARRQSAKDWSDFLAARAVEMAPGAKLLSLAMGATPEVHGWEWITSEAWQAAQDMQAEGLISPVELKRFTLPVLGRTQADLQAPFAGGSFHGLTLDFADARPAPDPFWDDFQETGDAALLGRRWSGMMRAVCGPFAVAAFSTRPNGGELVDELFARLAVRVAANPQRHVHFAAITVISKA
jgi:hypothetical protein